MVNEFFRTITGTVISGTGGRGRLAGYLRYLSDLGGTSWVTATHAVPPAAWLTVAGRGCGSR